MRNLKFLNIVLMVLTFILRWQLMLVNSELSTVFCGYDICFVNWETRSTNVTVHLKKYWNLPPTAPPKKKKKRLEIYGMYWPVYSILFMFCQSHLSGFYECYVGFTAWDTGRDSTAALGAYGSKMFLFFFS